MGAMLALDALTSHACQAKAKVATHYEKITATANISLIYNNASHYMPTTCQSICPEWWLRWMGTFASTTMMV